MEQSLMEGGDRLEIQLKLQLYDVPELLRHKFNDVVKVFFFCCKLMFKVAKRNLKREEAHVVFDSY